MCQSLDSNSLYISLSPVIAYPYGSLRFVSLMEGHIWLESEGAGKGCTATFIVKLGTCEGPIGYQQQVVPKARPNHREADLSGARAPSTDEKGLARYQSV